MTGMLAAGEVGAPYRTLVSSPADVTSRMVGPKLKCARYSTAKASSSISLRAAVQQEMQVGICRRAGFSLPASLQNQDPEEPA